MEWIKLLSTKTQVEREKEPKKWGDYPISDFEKDYKSIISSAAFRRLQDKTQVFPLDKSDFVRTRLTHSVEVSTIAKQLGIMVTQNTTGYLPEDFNQDHNETTKIIPSVLSCAGLLHDLGNPPFGHFGEVVIGDWFKQKLQWDGQKQFNQENDNAELNTNKYSGNFIFKGVPIRNLFSEHEQMIKDLCNFEGNAQALRILSKVKLSPSGYDANLTYSVMNALIKYPTASTNVNNSKEADVKLHKLGYFSSEEVLFNDICIETGTKLADGTFSRHPLTFLVEAADDIAYATADLEDALKKGMFTIDQFINYFDTEINKLTDGNEKDKSIDLINNLKERLNAQVRNSEEDLAAFQKWTIFVKGWLMYVVAFSFSKNYRNIMNGTYSKDMFHDGFHKYSIKILKGAMSKFVFDSTEILKLELSAQKIISSLLNDFIYAVMYWKAEDDEHKLTKSQKKFINIISENYKNDYLHSCGDDEIRNLYLRFLMVTDFISGMTDSYAKNLYQELNGID